MKLIKPYLDPRRSPASHLWKCDIHLGSLSRRQLLHLRAHLHRRLVNSTKMTVAYLAQVKNFKIHWTSVGCGARGITDRHEDFSANISQCNNVKRMATVSGEHNEPLSQEIDHVLRLLFHGIGYWDLTRKLQRHYLIAFQDAVNKGLRANMFGR